MRRRHLLHAAPALLAAPRLAGAQGARTLRFVPQGNLANVDPIWTTTVIARNHGLMVYDTLFGLGRDFQPKPQMAAGHDVSADGLRHTISLRADLRFHDGEKVTARDCIASIARWSKRDVLGQRLNALLEEMRALADDRFEIVLKRPWPGLAWALGKPSANICAIMPERVAQTDPFQQITEHVGSGPFRFRASQWVPGSIAVYERSAHYVPRDEPADFLAGGKQVFFDRVEWRIMPDPATAAAALQNNEVDWWETPLADLLPVLRRNREIAIEVVNTAGNLGVLRFNHLHPPFDKPEIRRAIFPAIDQKTFMQAALGEDAALWQVPAGAFTPGTPLANDSGLEALTGPRDPEAAKRALRAAGYDGRKVVMLVPTDFPTLNGMSEVAADALRKIGMNIDAQAMDWGTLVQRRAKKDPPEQGGWNLFVTSWEGLDVSVPGSHQPLRGNGQDGWFGWSSSPRREALREAWFAAPDQAAEKRIAADLQQALWEEAPFVPLGLLRPPMAYRRSLSNIVVGGPALFWNVRRG
ncbi:ABC transporter substrate-binding protein [Paracraurococcus ruber]|uniref:ABC transporter substrate-binding protein n=1 Tax=Paracraurococcus ruber TaxID=77675 RepID=A0ABS1CTC4_9PROT|nr:ABC transporter substrate-binding protein [Paracraurococcus ruber]MBK1657603.1 ABC transporter substrate-binding protein [Paracraurococcus ruber]TDG32477.1 ABC transporter substrate-binding protein [Paracraurococcus ruber]